MALSIAIGAVIGWYLDQKFGTEPWLFFVFLALGIVLIVCEALLSERKKTS